MSSHYESVVDLLSVELVHTLARPSDARYGQAIHDRGGVEFISRERCMVEAWVGGLNGAVVEGGSQRRRTRLFAAANGLAWHCTGNPANHQIFCKHCVALALAILDEGVA